MKTVKASITLILVLLLGIFTSACGKAIDTDKLWESATYTADTTLGEGANTVAVEISAGEKSVILTLNTDKATLGEALFELGLVNDASFFDVCNGIKADWDKDQAYWSFHVGGELAQHGIGDAQAVTDDAPAYKLVYTK